MRITGYVTRLIPGELGAADRIFVQPDAHIDLRWVDGKHRTAAGELMVEGNLEGRKVNDLIELELSGESDPLLTTLRVV